MWSYYVSRLISFLSAKFIFILLPFLLVADVHAQKDPRKSYLEDIFIWKMSDELKLSVPEEKKFSEIQKDLNKRKTGLNQKIQTSIEVLTLAKKQTEVDLNKQLNQHGSYLKKYNDLASEEFSEMRKLLGSKRFVDYLRIRNELNNKMKSLLVGEGDKSSASDTKKTEKSTVLPPPQVIIEN